MWQKISGFSDYLINEKGCIFRVSTKKIFEDASVVSLKADSGLWKNRSVAKLISDVFDIYDGGIVAEPIKPGETEKTFSSIKEAAEWLIATKQAITAGKLAAYQTVRTNIKRGISQPKLYPYVYGYSWRINERSDQIGFQGNSK